MPMGLHVARGTSPKSGVERPGNREMRFEPARCSGSSRTISSPLSPRLSSSRRMPVGLHRVAGSNPAGSINSAARSSVGRAASTIFRRRVSRTARRKPSRTGECRPDYIEPYGGRVRIPAGLRLVAQWQSIWRCLAKFRRRGRQMPTGLHGESARTNGRSAVRVRPGATRVAQKASGQTLLPVTHKGAANASRTTWC